MDTVKEFLLNEYKKLDDIPDINYGGCGIAAFIVHSLVEREFGVYLKIIAVFDSEFEMNTDLVNLENGDYDMVGNIMHVLIESEDGDLLDSSGTCNYYWKYPYLVIGRGELLEIINRAEWNPTFDRKKWIPIFEEMYNLKIIC